MVIRLSYPNTDRKGFESPVSRQVDAHAVRYLSCKLHEINQVGGEGCASGTAVPQGQIQHPTQLTNIYHNGFMRIPYRIFFPKSAETKTEFNIELIMAGSCWAELAFEAGCDVVRLRQDQRRNDKICPMG